MQVVGFIVGALDETEPKTIRMVQRFNAVFGLPGLTLPAPTQDPLKESAMAKPDDLTPVITEVAPAVGASTRKSRRLRQ
jgi:hypothetical protein